jgi:hypothetical protein
MKKEIEQLENREYRLTEFMDDPVYHPVCNPEANYTDYSWERDIPCGARLGVITIDVKGTIRIKGLRIRYPRSGRVIVPLPASLFRSRPISEGSQIYICFDQPLDLRSMCLGDVRLCLTIVDYSAGSTISIAYGIITNLIEKLN